MVKVRATSDAWSCVCICVCVCARARTQAQIHSHDLLLPGAACGMLLTFNVRVCALVLTGLASCVYAQIYLQVRRCANSSTHRPPEPHASPRQHLQLAPTSAPRKRASCGCGRPGAPVMRASSWVHAYACTCLFMGACICICVSVRKCVYVRRCTLPLCATHTIHALACMTRNGGARARHVPVHYHTHNEHAPAGDSCWLCIMGVV